ncbi:MAG: ABC transporter permease [Fibrobacteria bacterium]|nr:ABC transporter permease [Fibrobacteria bacterium]
MLLLMAWRNLWRNRSRSLITMASVFFAVLLATVMTALQIGSYDRMVENVAGQYTGYLQVHRRGYWDDKSLDNAFAQDEVLLGRILSVPRVRGIAPRLETFALASNGNTTLGCQVVGISPHDEDRITGLGAKVSAGRYLAPTDQGVMIADGLAERLGLSLGDTLVLFGQGYHGATAGGKFPVIGLVHFGSPEVNDHLVNLSLEAARELFSSEGLSTAWVVETDPGSDLGELVRSIASVSGGEYEVMDWKGMMPDLQQAIAADRAGGLIMVGILYLILAFGIFGTVVMMSHERKREFGVLVSIGMRRRSLAGLLFIESTILTGLGVASGLAASLPIVWWMSIHPLRFSGQVAEASAKMGLEPIFPTTTRPDVFLQQGTLVWVMAMVIALVPVARVLKLDPLEASRR